MGFRFYDFAYIIAFRNKFFRRVIGEVTVLLIAIFLSDKALGRNRQNINEISFGLSSYHNKLVIDGN